MIARSQECRPRDGNQISSPSFTGLSDKKTGFERLEGLCGGCIKVVDAEGGLEVVDVDGGLEVVDAEGGLEVVDVDG